MRQKHKTLGDELSALSGTGDDPASSPEAIADNAELHARIMRRAEERAKPAGSREQPTKRM